MSDSHIAGSLAGQDRAPGRLRTAPENTRVRWKGVVLFYLLACVFSWPFFWWRHVHTESFNALPWPYYLKTWSYMCGPALAALVVLSVRALRPRVRRISCFGGAPIRSLAFYAAPIALWAALGTGADEPMGPHVTPLLYGLVSLVSILGEELGWRGYLQEALRPMRPWRRYLVIGVMWEFWHFTARPSSAQAEVYGLVVVLAVSYIGTILFAALLGVLVERSRSVLVAVTLHSWANAVVEVPQPHTFIVLLSMLPLWTYLLWTWPPLER